MRETELVRDELVRTSKPRQSCNLALAWGQRVRPFGSRRVLAGNGCPPAEDFVPPLMQHLHEPYYVALLSAANVYGAAHDARGVLQVMARLNRKAIDCGKSRVQFVGRKDLERTPGSKRTGRGGRSVFPHPRPSRSSSSVMPDQCGGLEHVASVVSELVGAMTPEELIAAAPLGPIAWAQRLGYLLDVTDHRQLGDELAPVVRDLANDFASDTGSSAPRTVPRAPAHETLVLHAAGEELRVSAILAGGASSRCPQAFTPDLCLARRSGNR